MSAEAEHDLGLRLWRGGALHEAAARFRTALALRPAYRAAAINLAGVLKDLGAMAESIRLYHAVLDNDPDDLIAHYNLGHAYQLQDRPAAAEHHYRQALRLDPAQVETLTNLAAVLRDRGLNDAALACRTRVVRLRPDCADAHHNLGSALQDLDRPDPALASYRRALALNPAAPATLCNLGLRLVAEGRMRQAIGVFGRAAALTPDLVDAQWNLALALLTVGELERGFALYEWRWKCRGKEPHNQAYPLWDGGPLDGRTILLHGEQGYGDTIQFARYAATVKDRGGRVVLLCLPAQETLFRALPGTDLVTSRPEEVPPCDVQAPLPSLPWLCGTTLETIPAAIPYLAIDDDRCRRWRRRLAEVGTPRVGLVWRGSPVHTNDRNRSLPVSALAPLVAGPPARFVSLQKDATAEELATLNAAGPVLPLGNEVADFADTAAAIAALDLVITVDTSVAHLAGALGAPLWLLLPRPADWRWLEDREDSPWYPTARLFRQPTPGAWDAVVRRVAEALERAATGARLADTG